MACPPGADYPPVPVLLELHPLPEVPLVHHVRYGCARGRLDRVAHSVSLSHPSHPITASPGLPPSIPNPVTHPHRSQCIASRALHIHCCSPHHPSRPCRLPTDRPNNQSIGQATDKLKGRPACSGVPSGGTASRSRRRCLRISSSDLGTFGDGGLSPHPCTLSRLGPGGARVSTTRISSLKLCCLCHNFLGLHECACFFCFLTAPSCHTFWFSGQGKMCLFPCLEDFEAQMFVLVSWVFLH